MNWLEKQMKQASQEVKAWPKWKQKLIMKQIRGEDNVKD